MIDPDFNNIIKPDTTTLIGRLTIQMWHEKNKKKIKDYKKVIKMLKLT